MQSLPPNVAGGVVYQPAGPPSYPGTFSPAGSVEGSPMHMNYMNQPGQTGGPYQAMPPTGEDHHTPLKAYLWVKSEPHQRLGLGWRQLTGLLFPRI